VIGQTYTYPREHDLVVGVSNHRLIRYFEGEHFRRSKANTNCDFPFRSRGVQPGGLTEAKLGAIGDLAIKFQNSRLVFQRIHEENF
jgi:hypothetical protein